MISVRYPTFEAFSANQRLGFWVCTLRCLVLSRGYSIPCPPFDFAQPRWLSPRSFRWQNDRVSGLASDSSKHILRGFFIWKTPLVVLILSSFRRHYINPFSSGGSALRNDWTQGSALSELMPSTPQLVDLDRLPHVTPVLVLVFAVLLTQSD